LAAPMLLLAAASGYGLPSLRGVRDDLDRRLGTRTPDILAARCTHVAGNYWNVWPSVFHANLVLHERGERRVVWGVTLRSQPTHSLWEQMPREEICVGIPVGDTVGEGWLNSYHFPRMVEVERRPTLRILRPKAAVRSTQAISTCSREPSRP